MVVIILFVVFLILELACLVVNIWNAKLERDEQRIHSTVIYDLYNELKRYNDCREVKIDDSECDRGTETNT